MTATGTFEVQMAPFEGDEEWGSFARLSIDKTFSGDIEGTSRGQMLAAHTGVEGSAGYVALERVTATIDGREGSFALQHMGAMRRGEPGLTIAVVPDSGTGDLAGIDGTMELRVEAGVHHYTFEYSLP